MTPHKIIESENKEFLSQFPNLKEDDNPILLIGAQNIGELKKELEAAKQHIQESQKVQQELSGYIKELSQEKQALKSELSNQSATIKCMEEASNTYLIHNNLKSKLMQLKISISVKLM